MYNRFLIDEIVEGYNKGIVKLYLDYNYVEYNDSTIYLSDEEIKTLRQLIENLGDVKRW